MIHSPKRKFLLSSQQGLSLMEIMIAVGVGAILTWGIATLMRNSGKEMSSVSAKSEFNSFTNELQALFNNPDRCRAAFGAANTVIPDIELLGLPTDSPGVQMPVALNTGNTDLLKGALAPPIAQGSSAGPNLHIQKFEFYGKRALKNLAGNKQFNVALRLVASRRVGGYATFTTTSTATDTATGVVTVSTATTTAAKTGSETAIGGDTLQKTFNLVITWDKTTKKIIGCAGQAGGHWKSTGPKGLDIINLKGVDGGNVGIGMDPGVSTTGVQIKLDVDGHVQGIGYQYRSDGRMKENVREIASPLERVLQLRGVRFSWKDKEASAGGEEELGFVAQEVEATFPEAVVTNSGTGMKSVAYENLLAPLVEAMKERQKTLLQRERELAKIREALPKE